MTMTPLIFNLARARIMLAEIDLHRKLRPGERRDLLCDNSSWDGDTIKETVERIEAQEGQERQERDLHEGPYNAERHALFICTILAKGLVLDAYNCSTITQISKRAHDEAEIAHEREQQAREA